MTMKKMLILWAIGSILWILAVTVQVFEHYSPLLKQSNYIYNPMISPEKLMQANAENRERLVRSYQDGDGNIYSFGMAGVVGIEFSQQAFTGDILHTWMPYRGSVASFEATSPEWQNFRQSLVEQALSLREKQKQETFERFLVADSALIFGVPVIFLVLMIGCKTCLSSLYQRTGQHFPDL